MIRIQWIDEGGVVQKMLCTCWSDIARSLAELHNPTRVTKMKTGIERLRQIVNLCNYTRESTFDNLDVTQTVRLAEACLNSEWDVYPDDLTDKELTFAAKHGRLPRSVAKRFG